MARNEDGTLVRFDVQKLINSAPHFTIAGTGRSGSTHISMLLRKVGLLCGHENWWTPHQNRIRFGMDGDSSWMVAPLLDRYKGVTLLQIRHPLKVINSYVGLNDGAFMRGELIDDEFWKLHRATLPRLNFVRDPIDNAAHWWTEVNEHILDFSTFTWRLEDIDGALLQQICKAAGWGNVTLEECEKSVEATPASHRHPGKPAAVGWTDILEPIRSRTRELAEHFGYDVD